MIEINKEDKDELMIIGLDYQEQLMDHVHDVAGLLTKLSDALIKLDGDGDSIELIKIIDTIERITSDA